MKPTMKYLLLVHFPKNKSETYYADDPDKLKEYAESRGFEYWEVYELNKTVYQYVTAREKVI